MPQPEKTYDLRNTEGVFAHGGDVIMAPGRKMSRVQAIALACWLLTEAETARDQGGEETDKTPTDDLFSGMMNAIHSSRTKQDGAAPDTAPDTGVLRRGGERQPPQQPQRGAAGGSGGTPQP